MFDASLALLIESLRLDIFIFSHNQVLIEWVVSEFKQHLFVFLTQLLSDKFVSFSHQFLICGIFS